MKSRNEEAELVLELRISFEAVLLDLKNALSNIGRNFFKNKIEEVEKIINKLSSASSMKDYENIHNEFVIIYRHVKHNWEKYKNNIEEKFVQTPLWLEVKRNMILVLSRVKAIVESDANNILEYKSNQVMLQSLLESDATITDKNVLLERLMYKKQLVAKMLSDLSFLANQGKIPDDFMEKFELLRFGLIKMEKDKSYTDIDSLLRLKAQVDEIRESDFAKRIEYTDKFEKLLFRLTGNTHHSSLEKSVEKIFKQVDAILIDLADPEKFNKRLVEQQYEELKREVNDVEKQNDIISGLEFKKSLASAMESLKELKQQLENLKHNSPKLTKEAEEIIAQIDYIRESPAKVVRNQESLNNLYDGLKADADALEKRARPLFHFFKARKRPALTPPSGYHHVEKKRSR